MDLVSLETQQENDYIQNWLDSRNLTYTWTSGRWAYIQCPHTFIILWYKHRNIWSTIPTTGFVTLTAVTDQTCSPSVSRGGFGRGPTRRLHQPTKLMTGKTWMGGSFEKRQDVKLGNISCACFQTKHFSCSWDYKPWSNTGHLKKDQPDNAEFGINKWDSFTNLSHDKWWAGCE